MFKNNIVKNLDIYKSIVKTLYDNPEIGLQEFETSKLLSKVIQDLGFDVTYPYVLNTGFMGKYVSKKKGPKIAFLCEYDALPEVGHGCGHNLISAISIAGACALKEVIDDIGGEIYLMGTPAEENFGGKIEFVKGNAFKDIDLALMLHPGTSNRIGSKTLALMPIKFEFFGKNSAFFREDFAYNQFRFYLGVVMKKIRKLDYSVFIKYLIFLVIFFTFSNTTKNKTN